MMTACTSPEMCSRPDHIGKHCVKWYWWGTHYGSSPINIFPGFDSHRCGPINIRCSIYHFLNVIRTNFFYYFFFTLPSLPGVCTIVSIVKKPLWKVSYNSIPNYLPIYNNIPMTYFCIYNMAVHNYWQIWILLFDS